MREKFDSAVKKRDELSERRENAIKEKLEDEIKRFGHEDKAEKWRKYFKTGKGQYAENDKFIGLEMPEIVSYVNKYMEIDDRQLLELLKSRYHECRSIALSIMVKRFERADEEEKKKIFEFYLNNTKCVNNWDLVDISAPVIVGGYLFGKEGRILERLARSDNLWERRIAIISTQTFINKGICKESLEIAEILLNDSEDLIHKAVGWTLREVGKKCGIEKEEEFLQKHFRIMPRTMLRYAIEKFPPEKRDYYMAK
ncbi:MAG: DNA alkylation repair protein [bacterium]|nr:DNA alkylation repair protein [bacterium]